MKKDIIRYSFLTIILIILLTSVYPTLYRYDKFDQKIPVRINRITGSAEMLYQSGWQKAETVTPSKTEMQNFHDSMDLEFDSLKRELESNFDNVKDGIEKDVSNTLRAEILKDIKSDIKQAKEDIKVYKESKLDSKNTFSVGSVSSEVKKTMGLPDSIETSEYMSYWHYGSSSITFNSGKVEGWRQGDVELNVR